MTDRPIGEAQLDALTDAAAALARSTDLDSAVAAILETTATSLGATAAAIFLRHPDRADLYLGAHLGMSDADAAEFEAQVADPAHPVAVALREVQAVFGRDLVGGTPGTAADMPLVVAHDGADLSLGVLTLRWAADHEPARGEERLARVAADLVATAVDRAHLGSLLHERSEWYERMAHTDSLTGLANSRTFERVLDLELARAGRQGIEISLVAFDLDGFSALNAERGHAAGDDVLRAFAAVLAEGVRLVDTVARFGPDEFGVIAPGAGGIVVARRVLDAIAAGRAGTADVTVSAAVVRFPEDGASTPELLAAAEGALATARAAGPAAVEAAPYDPPEPAPEGDRRG